MIVLDALTAIRYHGHAGSVVTIGRRVSHLIDGLYTGRYSRPKVVVSGTRRFIIRRSAATCMRISRPSHSVLISYTFQVLPTQVPLLIFLSVQTSRRWMVHSGANACRFASPSFQPGSPTGIHDSFGRTCGIRSLFSVLITSTAIGQTFRSVNQLSSDLDFSKASFRCNLLRPN